MKRTFGEKLADIENVNLAAARAILEKGYAPESIMVIWAKAIIENAPNKKQAINGAAN